MVLVEGRYLGDLRCESTHGPSGAKLHTDAPADNMGKGEAFSPTDLVATAFGACVVTTIGIVAARRGMDVASMRYRVEKHMVSDPVRRVGRLPLTIWLPVALSGEERTICERAAHTCPVKRSLLADVETPIEFVYE